jgi:DNA (cytosine-5)-methyltransferase 1
MSSKKINTYNSFDDFEKELDQDKYLNEIENDSDISENNQKINITIEKDTINDIKSKIINPKIIDLFCGIGGFHKGFEPYECILASDIDKDCRIIYKNNYKLEPVGDIFDIDENKLNNFDILCGGIPCQPYSSSGKKLGLADVRAKPYDKVLSIVTTKRPSIVIIENVKNLLILDDSKIIEKIKNDFEKINYNFSYQLLNIYNFNLAQNRDRLFIVATRKDKYKYKFNFNKLISIHNNNKSLKDIIDLNNKNYIDKEKYVIIDKKYIKKQKSGLIFCGYIKGNLRKNGVIEDTEHLSRVHKQPNRIYHIDGVNPTLSASETSGRYYIYDNIGVRKLTINECYKIMGFTNFKLHENNGKAYHQVGNAVSPIIIKAIKEELERQNFI